MYLVCPVLSPPRPGSRDGVLRGTDLTGTLCAVSPTQPRLVTVETKCLTDLIEPEMLYSGIKFGSIQLHDKSAQPCANCFIMSIQKHDSEDTVSFESFFPLQTTFYSYFRTYFVYQCSMYFYCSFRILNDIFMGELVLR